MKFLVIVHTADRKNYEAGRMPEPKEMEPMGRFNDELAKAGVLQEAQGVQPTAKSRRVHFPGGGQAPVVTEGPFPDSLICGFWIWNVKSKEEALEWAKRAPMAPGDTLELRKCFDADDFGPEFARLFEDKKRRQS